MGYIIFRTVIFPAGLILLILAENDRIKEVGRQQESWY